MYDHSLELLFLVKIFDWHAWPVYYALMVVKWTKTISVPTVLPRQERTPSNVQHIAIHTDANMRELLVLMSNTTIKISVYFSKSFSFKIFFALSHAPFTMATDVSFETAIHVHPSEEAETYSADLQRAWSVGTGQYFGPPGGNLLY